MKKLAWMFSALSLCACSLSACGGDDDNDSKKANGETCSAAADCESNYCGADKKCAEKPAADDKAKENEDCSEKACDTGLKCDEESKKCVKSEGGNDDPAELTIDKMCEYIIGWDLDDEIKTVDECKAANSQVSEKCPTEYSAFLKCAADAITKCEDATAKACGESIDPACNDKSEALSACVEGGDAPDDSKAQKGESCAEKECADGLKCDDTSKVCVEDSTSGDAKKDNDAACQNSDECKSGYCNEDSKCADLPDDCTKDTDCKDSAKAVCDVASKKCVECTSESAAACELSTAAGPVCISNACAKCTDDAQCGGDKVCNKTTGACELKDGECFDDSDCKDATKPSCNKTSHTCEAASAAKDPCDGVTCTAGECSLGICVTDAMKAVKDGEAYPADAKNDAYCVGDSLYYKYDNKANIIDCKAAGFSGCVVFEEVKSEGVLNADCNAQASALKACDDAKKENLDAWKIDTCIGPVSLYEVWCTKDTSGNAIAVPTYDGKNDADCDENGKACSIETSGPVCK